MRYQDWDVLIFPSGKDSKVPVKEFKVACHVVPDAELSQTHTGLGLPVMTCFVPSLQPGTPFHVSIHSWGTPEISQFAKSYSKHPELIKFEARIMVDGRLVASTAFNRKGEWPHLINNTFEVTKHGDHEPLKFPVFRRELLYQNHWHPGDDIGRIKIVISEGFPRDSQTVPIERVKNVVAFSFQHAPLELLETNGIAWPNPQMWRRSLCNPALPVPTFSPDDGADSHAHSPRRRSFPALNTAAQQLSMPYPPNLQTTTFMPNATIPVSLLQRSAGSSSTFPEPITDQAYLEWINSLGLGQNQSISDGRLMWSSIAPRQSSKQSSTDTSMADYLSSQGIPEPMQLSGATLEGDVEMGHLKVPTNTPTAAGPLDDGGGSATPFTFNVPNSTIPGDLAASLTHSLLNQPHPLPIQPHQIPLPASEIKSRKENRYLDKAASRSPSTVPSPVLEAQTRKFSQTTSAFGVIGSGKERGASGSTGPVFSRQASLGEFGTNITNLAEQRTTPGGSAVSTGEKGNNKRTRNLTPASAKAIDDEDEPRRLSPRIRLVSSGDPNDQATDN